MSYIVNFKEVSTKGLESSPVASALAGLRANEARYIFNKYNLDFEVKPASKNKEIIEYVNNVLKEREIEFSSKPLEVASIVTEDMKMTYVFFESGLGVNVMYSLVDPKRRAVGFKLSEGMEVPEELVDKFKFARQKSKLAGVIRGSYFIIKKEY